MKVDKLQKGFTLIELLVVISIIGLLSSVVFASLNSARTKAQLAAGKAFDTHTYNAFGAEAAASYTFDDAVPGNVPDRSGNNKNLNTGNFTVVSGVKGNAIQFSSASSNYAQSTGVVAITNRIWTMSAWVRPASIQSGTIVFFSVGLPYLAVSSGVFGYSWYDSTTAAQLATWNSGRPAGYCTNLPAVKVNEWIHLTVTSNGSKVVGYINGKEVCSATSVASNTNPNRFVTVGAHDSTQLYFNGTVDEANIFTQSLLASEVQDLYLAGLPTHTVAARE